MSTDLKSLLVTATIILGLIVIVGLTTALRWFPLEGARSPSHLLPVCW